MTDTTGSINSKGLDGTGFTEDLISDDFNQVGRHHMAIVDLQVVDRHGPSIKGKRKVSYVIDSIEPATEEALAEHLRELQRGRYYERSLKDGQPTLDHEDNEPKVADVLAAGQALKPHPFLPADPSQDNPICDVCGVVEGASKLHDEKARTADPFTVPDDDEEPDPEDLEDELDEDDESN